uniref:Cyclin dependent kinase 2 associated protein 1 n=1 Tax=Felis catus TaxID=9685 RepID=A0ABI7ZZW1_FELCA
RRAAARRAAPSRPGPAPLAPLKVCGRPCARPPDVWVIYCSGCQGEGRPYLPVRPEPSTTKSARELGGRTDGRSDAGPASPPPGLAAAAAAAAALAGLAPRRPGAPRRSGGCLTNRTWPRTCPPPPSTPGTGNSQVPQSKYAELLAIIEELGKEIRPTYAGSKSAMERLKRGIIHARGLVRECLAETERNARS